MSLLQTDTGARAVKWRELAHRATLPLLGLALVALVVEVALVLLGPGSRDVMVRNCLVTGVVFVAAIATLLAGISRPAGTSAPWLALGLGILSYACAFLVF